MFLSNRDAGQLTAFNCNIGADHAGPAVTGAFDRIGSGFQLRLGGFFSLGLIQGLADGGFHRVAGHGRAADAIDLRAAGFLNSRSQRFQRCAPNGRCLLRTFQNNFGHGIGVRGDRGGYRAAESLGLCAVGSRRVFPFRRLLRLAGCHRDQQRQTQNHSQNFLHFLPPAFFFTKNSLSSLYLILFSQAINLFLHL